MIFIDIDGPSAVGKSSLIRSLQKDLPEAFPVDELLAQKSNPFCSWKTPEDFLQKQLWFFDNTLRRYTDSVSASGPHALQLNDIGVIDVIVHTAVFPLANHLPWSVFPAFREQDVYKRQALYPSHRSGTFSFFTRSITSCGSSSGNSFIMIRSSFFQSAVSLRSYNP